MSRHDEIKNAYKSLGGEATFYDGMITCSTLPGKAVCKLVWNMDKRKNDRYLELALSGIPQGFGGRMLGRACLVCRCMKRCRTQTSPAWTIPRI